MDVSVIIVSFNTKELLKNCLNSIYTVTKDVTFEIIVSDNNSTDGTIEMLQNEFEQVILVKNNENLGFGKANNQAKKIAQGKYIFYLNSDTILLNNAIKIFFDFFEQNANDLNLGAIGTNLLDKEKNITLSGENFPTPKTELINIFLYTISIYIKSIITFFTKKTPYTFIKPNFQKKTGEIDYICGAALFLPNNDFAIFDENYFLYYEETDLQFKLKNDGKKRFLICEPQIIHLEGGSDLENKNFDIKSYASFAKIQSSFSSIYFLKKNYNARFSVFFIKLFTTIEWLNPYLFKKTRIYIPKLWRL